MNEAKPYTEEEIADLKNRLGHYKSGRFPFVWWDPDTGSVEADRLVMSIAARDAEIASLRAELATLREQYADAIRALRKQLADAGECASCVGWRDGSHEPGCPTGTILSTPQAKAVLGTSDATHPVEGR